MSDKFFKYSELGNPHTVRWKKNMQVAVAEGFLSGGVSKTVHVYTYAHIRTHTRTHAL